MAIDEGVAPAADTGDGEAVHRLKPNAVGLLGVVFMAVATAAPITAMTGNVPFMVSSGNGIGAPASYLVAMVVLAIFSVGFTSMAKHITSTGAFYGFISYGLGRTAGLASGLLATFAYVVFEPALIGIFSTFATTTLKDQTGIHLPWWAFAILMLAINATGTWFGISVAEKLLVALLATEVTVLAAMAVSVAFHGGGPHGFSLAPVDPVNAFKGTSAGLGLFFAFWSWVGFESTAMYGEESRDPKKIIPKATMISVLGVGVFYVFVSWMAITGNGEAEAVKAASSANPLALFFNPTERYVGHWAVDVMQWLMITGSLACGMAFHNCAARYLYALGREGVLPSLKNTVGRTHARHGSPHIAGLVQTVVSAVLIAAFWIAGKDPYNALYVLLAILGTMAILVVQAVCSFAVLVYFRRNHPESRHWFRTFTAPLVGGIAMLGVVVLLVSNMGVAAGAESGSLLLRATPWLVALVAATGVGYAQYLKRRAPERYALLGRTVLEETKER
ncbi:amino acid/polyamine/organocation transporter (APC superfamily) [Streptomyces puniciscabiei]|uniref:Amino acid/polyamine/organocation transporter (APC superfamily) n=2 Tax=Streptomyces puniciscabiei TaxID=164348 RepID=A0A542UEW4_9ACTN|nr:APC family permease [Streptomyces puniciscabiei]TQK97612.1 amino acid/polyamine/organocation transporter (APC superfamily) [Streptomyces puniciscabiei]